MTMDAKGDCLDEDERLVLDLFLEEFQPQNQRERFLLGCYVSAIFLEPKEIRSRPKLAGYTGVSRQRIEQIEARGLRKIRIHGQFEKDELDYLCRIVAQNYRVEA